MLALPAADSSGPFDLINGVPVHPLVVHAAVVLVPVAALGLLLMVILPRFSRRLGWLVLLAAVAATAVCQVAVLAGRELKARVGAPGFDHEALGKWLPWFTAALSVAALVLWLVDRRRVTVPAPVPGGDPAALATAPSAQAPVSMIRKPAGRGAVGIVVALLSAVIAVATLVWVFRVGDSGARSVWTGVVATSETPTPSPSPTATPTATALDGSGSATPGASAGPAAFTMAQVASHNTATDCWAAIDGTVYNLTQWIDQHPGGRERIIALCGTDATTAFADQHAADALPQDQLAKLQLGTLA